MFRDRADGGSKLCDSLGNYRNRKDVLVLALPRGGVVTGFEIACYLHSPLDVLIVRKIGTPWQPELAAGAISETGAIVLNEDVVSGYGISEKYIDDAVVAQKGEIARRQKLYRKGRGLTSLEGKIVILVDDGVATGATMKAAVQTLKGEKIKKLVVALPVAPPETAKELKRMVDELFCLETPEYFMAVGSHYQDFEQVSDEEVVRLIEKSRAAEAKVDVDNEGDS